MNIETIKHSNCTIRIEQDDDPWINPREDCDNLGTMVCFHPRYELGDKDGKAQCLTDIRASKTYRESWDDRYSPHYRDLDSPAMINKTARDCGFIILPLYLYDHSGLAISTSPFSCPWDSGQVGFIYVTPQKARKEFRVKLISAKTHTRITNALKSDVKTYDSFLRGEVYGYIAKHDQSGAEDSCWGYIGDMSYVIEEAKSSAKYLDSEYQRSRLVTVKAMVRNRVPLEQRQQRLASLCGGAL